MASRSCSTTSSPIATPAAVDTKGQQPDNPAPIPGFRGDGHQLGRFPLGTRIDFPEKNVVNYTHTAVIIGVLEDGYLCIEWTRENNPYLFHASFERISGTDWAVTISRRTKISCDALNNYDNLTNLLKGEPGAQERKATLKLPPENFTSAQLRENLRATATRFANQTYDLLNRNCQHFACSVRGEPIESLQIQQGVAAAAGMAAGATSAVAGAVMAAGATSAVMSAGLRQRNRSSDLPAADRPAADRSSADQPSAADSDAPAFPWKAACTLLSAAAGGLAVYFSLTHTLFSQDTHPLLVGAISTAGSAIIAILVWLLLSFLEK